MNPIDELEKMLTEARIPFERIKVKYSDDEYNEFEEMFGEAGKWRRNQIVYGSLKLNDKDIVDWKFDAIWQAGSYGLPDDLECWGTLVGTSHVVMTVEEAFEIIKEHWVENNERDSI